VDAILGHAQSERAKVCTPSDPVVLMRDALERWSKTLAGILKSRQRAGWRK
jgi:hypothetical protein